MNSKYLWLFDNGHGDVINGENTTPSRQFTLDDGRTFYEGEFNRAIVARLTERCVLAGIRCALITPEREDVPLFKRVERANEWHAAIDKNCILVSVHANKGQGRGFEIFTSPGETRSDRVAEIFFRHFSQAFPTDRMRKDLSDGDSDKESPFTILTNTAMPAVLPESFFYDNPDECKRLLVPTERDRIADAYFRGILEIEKNGI